MTLSQLRTNLRHLLNESSAGFWTDAQLNAYLNMADDRVNSIISSTREDYYTVSATFATVAATKSYSMPSDCRFIRRMEIYNTADASDIVKVDEIRWPRMEANGDWFFTATGQPQRYVVRGTQFDLYPIPDAVYNMRLYYDQRPSDLSTDGDSPGSPVDFHDMIVLWAAVLAKKQNEEDDVGFGVLFDTRKKELIDTLTKRGSEDPTAVEAYLEGVI